MEGIGEFLLESNRIEGKYTVETHEVEAASVILELDEVSIPDLQCYVYATAGLQAKLRQLPGMNVRVGPHRPPPGGAEIPVALDRLLARVNAGTIGPYEAHVEYETLHPFMDGNGRSGRLLWLWQMLRVHGSIPKLGFLHQWYYQSLQGVRS